MLLVVPLSSLCLLAGCGSRGRLPLRRERSRRSSSNRPGAVSTIYSGQVVSRYVGNYGFRVGGMIIARPVEVGQQVAAGQILARLDPKDVDVSVRSATAQTSAAAAQSQAQTTDLARARRLLAEGFISQAEFDRQQAATRSAQAQLRSARAQQTGAISSFPIPPCARAGRRGYAVQGDVGEVVPPDNRCGRAKPRRDRSRHKRSRRRSRAVPRGPARRSPLDSPRRSIRRGYARFPPPPMQTRTFDTRPVRCAAGAAAIGSTAEVVIDDAVERPHSASPVGHRAAGRVP
jgi:pyruvate/2-oxoglutarate dehydrogenase complex dihydrolipoamide acyltransferase (E2) component